MTESASASRPILAQGWTCTGASGDMLITSLSYFSAPVNEVAENSVGEGYWKRMQTQLTQWVPQRRLLGDRLVRARSPDPTFTTAQPTAVSFAEGGVVVPAPATVGAGSSVGACACLRREFSGEADAGKPHLRFDEGRARRSPLAVTLSPALPARIGASRLGTKHTVAHRAATVRERICHGVVRA